MIGAAAEVGEQDIKRFVKRRAGATLAAGELSAWRATRPTKTRAPSRWSTNSSAPRARGS